mmetsp:Transcript_8813/g.20384  ORF Transcript_8813/g.20384 Transcript_8813/m.20384 type:complete len:102 (-) Transcript_8813:70-375(-)
MVTSLLHVKTTGPRRFCRNDPLQKRNTYHSALVRSCHLNLDRGNGVNVTFHVTLLGSWYPIHRICRGFSVKTNHSFDVFDSNGLLRCKSTTQFLQSRMPQQ